MIDKLGKYNILKEVGSGGMARVFLAKDPDLKREVAIKLLHEHLTSNKEALKRFEREAITTAQLNHKNIVNVYEYRSIPPYNFIVNEYIEGVTLQQFLEKNRIKYPIIGLMIVSEVCKAISYAHSEGVIHRDIKPENIMISNEGEIKVTDFGIARIIGETTMTMTGSILGSPAYMSPEQASGKPVDQRSDIFSIGTLLYKLTTNQLPFFGNHPTVVLKKVLEADYENPSKFNGLIDKQIIRLFEQTLTVSKKIRFQTVENLKIVIDKIIEEEGFKSSKKELTLFFKDPDSYQKNLKGILLENYYKISITNYKKHNTLKALRYCNKIFELDPQHPSTKTLAKKLKIIQTGSSFKRIILIISLTIIFFLLSLNLTISPLKGYNDIEIKKGKFTTFYSKIRSSISIPYSINDYNYNKQFKYDNHKIYKIKNRSKMDKMIKNVIDDFKDITKKSVKKGKKWRKKIKNRSTENLIVSKIDTKSMIAPILDKKKKTENSKVAIKKTEIIKKKKGKLLFCFRPYSTSVKIDGKSINSDCIIKPIDIEYGMHTIVAEYPYSAKFIRKFNIDKDHKYIELRYNFTEYSSVLFHFNSKSKSTFSLKNIDNTPIIALNRARKRVELSSINGNSAKRFYILPGDYYLDLTNGDIFLQNILIKIRGKKSYKVSMDINNDENITITNY